MNVPCSAGAPERPQESILSHVSNVARNRLSHAVRESESVECTGVVSCAHARRTLGCEAAPCQQDPVNHLVNSCSPCTYTSPVLVSISSRSWASPHRRMRRNSGRVAGRSVTPTQNPSRDCWIDQWLVDNRAEAWKRVRALVLLRHILRIVRRLGAAGMLERLYRSTWEVWDKSYTQLPDA